MSPARSRPATILFEHTLINRFIFMLMGRGAGWNVRPGSRTRAREGAHCDLSRHASSDAIWHIETAAGSPHGKNGTGVCPCRKNTASEVRSLAAGFEVESAAPR